MANVPNTIDNLLYFVNTHFDSLDRQHLNSVLVDFYSLNEFVASKATLIAECDKIDISNSISEYKKKRHNTRSENDTKLKLAKDILDIWTVADAEKAG